MANELPAAENYVHDALSGLLSGRVYSGIAPSGATYPLIVFQIQSPGSDLIVVGGNRVWAEPLVLARVIGKTGSWTTIAATADAIDAALHNTSGGVVAWCKRESPFSLVELTNGVQYRHLGGLYRLRVLGA